MSEDEIQYECSECGRTVSEQDKFCPHCGTSFEEVITSQDQVPQQLPKIQPAQAIPFSLPPFHSNNERVKWLTILLRICIVIVVISILSTYLQIELISSVVKGHTITMEQAESNDSRQQLIGIIQILAFIITSVYFFMWIHRAYRNLHAIGAINLKYSSGWAVGGFFVPFLNLVRPFQVMTEIWKASDPSISIGSSHDNIPSSPFVGQWWGFHLASNAIGWFSFYLSAQAETANSLLIASWAIIFGEIATIIAAVLEIKLVKAINIRQEEKYKMLTTAQMNSKVE